MNLQKDKEGSRYIKAALVSGIFVLLATCIGGFFLIRNTMVASSPNSQQPKKTQISSASFDSDGRYTESDGSFSYIPPTGWQIIEQPGLKYKVAVGTPTENFVPNMNFDAETYSGSLENYVSLNLEAFNKQFPNANIISQENFDVENGQTAIKIITENMVNEVQVHLVFYFIALRDKKFVITYSRLPDIGKENDILVDKSLKTFRINK